MDQVMFGVICAMIGASIGFFAAVLMMGAKYADQNDKVFRDEVDIRIREILAGYADLAEDPDFQTKRGRRKAANTNSVDNEATWADES